MDNLWDIPVHKISISRDKYAEPKIHPAIYYTATSAATVEKIFKPAGKNIKHIIPKLLR